MDTLSNSFTGFSFLCASFFTQAKYIIDYDEWMRLSSCATGADRNSAKRRPESMHRAIKTIEVDRKSLMRSVICNVKCKGNHLMLLLLLLLNTLTLKM
jgi:hypothetical protein